MRPYAFVIGPYGYFRPRLRKCVRPSYGTVINGFAKKALVGPYGSYDNKACSLGKKVGESRSHLPHYCNWNRQFSASSVLSSNLPCTDTKYTPRHSSSTRYWEKVIAWFHDKSSRTMKVYDLKVLGDRAWRHLCFHFCRCCCYCCFACLPMLKRWS